MGNPKEHAYWNVFWAWAEENGCDSEHKEDWLPWWECFVAGVQHGVHRALCAIERERAEEEKNNGKL